MKTGVGGGNMRPEYYADLYKRYATFIRNYGDEPNLQNCRRSEC